MQAAIREVREETVQKTVVALDCVGQQGTKSTRDGSPGDGPTSYYWFSSHPLLSCFVSFKQRKLCCNGTYAVAHPAHPQDQCWFLLNVQEVRLVSPKCILVKRVKLVMNTMQQLTFKHPFFIVYKKNLYIIN